MKRYVAKIPSINMSISISKEEFCTFITHFGKFGNIEIYDLDEDIVILNTIGVCINMFYPELENRNFASHKAKQYHKYFTDYNYQRKSKYPKGRLKELYISLQSVTSAV